MILTGHWHILSGIIATIILLYYADLAGVTGRTRQFFGWTVIIFSDLAFGVTMVYVLKRLFVSESAEGMLIRVTTLLMDIGLGTVLLALAALMTWRLIDLLATRGRWRQEMAEDRRDHTDAQEAG